MQVLKFGGTSVASSSNINRCIDIIGQAAKRDKTAAVFSAIAGCTDKLIETANLASSKNPAYKKMLNQLTERHMTIIDDIIPRELKKKTIEKCQSLTEELMEIHAGAALLGELSSTAKDLIMSYGEMLSTTIISSALDAAGISNTLVDSRNLIKTFKQASRNNVHYEESTENINDFLNNTNTRVYVVPGFIASDSQSRTTTLGRGGSDYTAAIFAAASKARILEIWTDVNGMMTADPSIVEEAFTIRHISYKEALELSHFGAKVLYPPTIQPAVRERIPIAVRNTFDPHGKYTIIEENPPSTEALIKGISSSKKIALLSLEGNDMVGIPGYSARLFSALARHRINIILITQASSVHTMCVAIDQNDAEEAGKAANQEFAYEITLGKVNPVVIEKNYSIITLVGDDMKNQSGTSGKMFDALGRERISIRAIAQGSSEKNISAVIDSSEREVAVKAIHDSFFGSNTLRKTLIYIAGYGNVGRELHKVITGQRSLIGKEKGVDLIVAGICTSDKSITDKKGIPEEADPYQSGVKSDINRFIAEIAKNPANKTLFVDCTAETQVANLYRELLEKGISVVTCNKIAPSSALNNWKELKETARENNCSLLYETTAGAGLPILHTIERLRESGEEILEIEAILSGTLNFIYSNYNSTRSFESLVQEAAAKGYAEPDPSTDLSGTDVVRKSVIIARECGFDAEIQRINCTPATPIKLKEGKEVRYTALIRKGSYSVQPSLLDKDHPLCMIKGTDNSVRITTSGYPGGITITGAGAGARVTAGGLLNDIIKASV
jgi:aspartokinase/homoserine dehydrogenase 1